MCEIHICLGSSCFARGNSENLRVLREYLETHGLTARVITVGHLCQDHCSNGPNLTLDGIMYHAMDAAALRALLDRRFGEGERP